MKGCSLLTARMMNADAGSDRNRSSSTSNERSVKLLLLRHGEREDEAIQRSMSIEERKRSALLPKELQVEVDALDPTLTERGYEQAMEAWQNILLAISRHQGRTNRKAQVTLVCSPLRRCIGTALMIVSALPLLEDTDTSSNRNTFEFCSTIGTDLGSFNTETTPRTRKVPIHVMNGLATCAAAIFKFGGVTRTIQQYGYDIPCAVTANENDHSSQHQQQPTINLFNAALQSMIQVARRPFQVKSQTRSSASSATSVQYFGIPNPTDDLNVRAFPMSLEISSQLSVQEVRPEQDHTLHHPTTTDDIATHRTTTSFATPERTRPDPVTTQYTTTSRTAIKTTNDHYNESFMGALNQAVYLALNNTTTTTTSTTLDDIDAVDRYIVVITHREGIRSLMNHCTNLPNRISTPYCCIGTFTATTTASSRPNIHSNCNNEKPEILYAVHNVSSYEHFTL